jgi:hypothetical protein
MSYSTVPVSDAVQQYNIVKYDSALSKWVVCNDNTDQLIGSVSEAPYDANGERVALVYWGGLVSALADESIVTQGGFIGVRNGRVYVESVNRYGIVQPLAFDQLPINAGDLVNIHLR